MEIIAKLGALLGLPFISGINLYATVAVVGICTRFGLVQGLPPELHVLGNEGVIFVAVVLYLVEFFADKIPGLDTLWDAIHTLIRPVGGAMLALLQVGDASPVLDVLVFLLGASLASAAHMTKAGTRLIINTSPEPFSNVLVSLGEDVGAVGFTYLCLAHPTLGFFLTLMCLGLVLFFMPLIYRTVRMLFAALLFRVKCFFWKEAAWTASRTLPFSLDALWDATRESDERMIWTGRVYAVRIPHMRRSTPMQAVITSRGVHLLYRRWFRSQEHLLRLDEIRGQKLRSGTLLSRWLLRTSRGDWMFSLYQPLARTLPQDWQDLNMRPRHEIDVLPR